MRTGEIIMRQEIVDNGILTINGAEYHLQTIYPLGRKRPEYKLWYVWEKFKPGMAFASDEGFERWCEEVMAEPVQARLL